MTVAIPRQFDESFLHWFRLGEPCQAGNPILSIYQSDMIIYGVDLRHYFFTEFAELFSTGKEDSQSLLSMSDEEMRERMEQYRAIPFWGEFLL